jgi:hypothetical protein
MNIDRIFFVQLTEEKQYCDDFVRGVRRQNNKPRLFASKFARSYPIQLLFMG